MGTAKAPTAVVVGVKGDSTVRRKGQAKAVPIKLKDQLYRGDVIETGPDSMVRLLVSGSVITVNENTTLAVDEGGTAENQKIELLKGQIKIHFEKITPGGNIEIYTPSATVAPRG